MKIIQRTRLDPPEPVYCHVHEVFECAAVFVDADHEVPTTVCHAPAADPFTPLCAMHRSPAGLP